MGYETKKGNKIKVRGTAVYPQLDKKDAVTKKFQTKIFVADPEIVKALKDLEESGLREFNCVCVGQTQYIVMDGGVELYLKTRFKPKVFGLDGGICNDLVLNRSDIEVFVEPQFVKSDHFTGVSLNLGAVKLHRNGKSEDDDYISPSEVNPFDDTVVVNTALTEGDF